MLTLALMPPCAHTECERFTGTSEKRSTGTPASQSLMTVISPASPPPTTTTRRTLPDSLRLTEVADLEAAMQVEAGRGKGAGCQTLEARVLPALRAASSDLEQD